MFPYISPHLLTIPQNIAGHPVRDYMDKLRSRQDFRIKLCASLQAKLVLNLCEEKTTPDVLIRDNHDLLKRLWGKSGLDFRYTNQLGPVLRGNPCLSP